MKKEVKNKKYKLKKWAKIEQKKLRFLNKERLNNLPPNLNLAKQKMEKEADGSFSNLNINEHAEEKIIAKHNENKQEIKDKSLNIPPLPNEQNKEALATPSEKPKKLTTDELSLEKDQLINQKINQEIDQMMENKQTENLNKMVKEEKQLIKEIDSSRKDLQEKNLQIQNGKASEFEEFADFEASNNPNDLDFSQLQKNDNQEIEEELRLNNENSWREEEITPHVQIKQEPNSNQTFEQQSHQQKINNNDNVYNQLEDQNLGYANFNNSNFDPNQTQEMIFPNQQNFDPNQTQEMNFPNQQNFDPNQSQEMNLNNFRVRPNFDPNRTQEMNLNNFQIRPNFDPNRTQEMNFPNQQNFDPNRTQEMNYNNFQIQPNSDPNRTQEMNFPNQQNFDPNRTQEMNYNNFQIQPNFNQDQSRVKNLSNGYQQNYYQSNDFPNQEKWNQNWTQEMQLTPSLPNYHRQNPLMNQQERSQSWTQEITYPNVNSYQNNHQYLGSKIDYQTPNLGPYSSGQRYFNNPEINNQHYQQLFPERDLYLKNNTPDQFDYFNQTRNQFFYPVDPRKLIGYNFFNPYYLPIPGYNIPGEWVFFPARNNYQNSAQISNMLASNHHFANQQPLTNSQEIILPNQFQQEFSNPHNWNERWNVNHQEQRPNYNWPSNSNQQNFQNNQDQFDFHQNSKKKIEFFNQDDGQSILKIANLSVVLKEKMILHHLNLKLIRNKFHLIIGPSSSGKSALCQTIIGNLPIFSGQIIWNINSKDIDKPFSYFTNKSLITSKLTVSEYLAKEVENQLASHKNQKINVDRLLEMLKLTKQKKQVIDLLSSSENKKLQIVEALIKKSKIWIVDDFLAGLDSILTKQFLEVFNKQKQITFLFTSTELNKFIEYADAVTFLNKGTIISSTDKINYSNLEKQYLELF